MSFFTKALSKVGIGAAKIDAVLDFEQIEPGQEITGTINISGGKAEQEINKVDLDVYCNYFVERQDEEGESETIEQHCKINSWDIEESFTISPGEDKQIPFSFVLSEQAPLSIGKSTTWLKTNLDIDYALDKSDKDYIEVVPNQLQAAVLSAIEEMGFEMVDAECEGCEGHRGQLPFIQEFEFKARRGDFRGKLDELELVMMASGDQLRVHLEIDRRARGFSGFLAEAFGRDETNVYFDVSEHNIDDVGNTIYDLIDQHS